MNNIEIIIGLMLMTVLSIVFLPATRAAGKESGPPAAPSPPGAPSSFPSKSQPLESVAPNIRYPR
jgi:hypothetical protein